MSRQGLYAVIAVLVVVVVGFGIYMYQQQSEPSGVQIELNEQGVSVEAN
ncbi:hypothetical protein [Pelagibacterium sediminicola]|nr:hypothetical protein [Pelagibacterium sediminicola]